NDNDNDNNNDKDDKNEKKDNGHDIQLHKEKEPTNDQAYSVHYNYKMHKSRNSFGYSKQRGRNRSMDMEYSLNLDSYGLVPETTREHMSTSTRENSMEPVALSAFAESKFVPVLAPPSSHFAPVERTEGDKHSLILRSPTSDAVFSHSALPLFHLSDVSRPAHIPILPSSNLIQVVDRTCDTLFKVSNVLDDCHLLLKEYVVLFCVYINVN
ncbi:hypothetical protein RFI_26794, partial [Reticulomyxa filosa]